MSHWFLRRIAERGENPAFLSEAGAVSHRNFATLAERWLARLDAAGLRPGATVVVHADYAPESAALIFALAARQAVVVPLTPVDAATLEARAAIAGAEAVIEVAPDGRHRTRHRAAEESPPLVAELRRRGRAGLILFSSGSTGAPKACLLDLDSLLETTRAERRGFRTLVFLLLDHIGGINTMIRVLGHGGSAVVVPDRSVETVAAAIERHRVELLPTSPTFLKMLLIADAPRRFDLTSLEVVTYGTEVMPPATLAALREALPRARLKQTYGLSEIGILPTRSRGADSLWLKIGGEGVEHRVVEGILQVRAPTAMLGYLNAPSPFDAEGWLNTQDRVETDGEWLRILGRDSELINVGGEKVHPTEVENVLLSAPNIRDATVAARANPVTGAVVVATLDLIEREELASLRHRLDSYCRARLEPWKVPALFRIADAPLHSARFKKIRAPSA